MHTEIIKNINTLSTKEAVARYIELTKESAFNIEHENEITYLLNKIYLEWFNSSASIKSFAITHDLELMHAWHLLNLGRNAQSN
jgi:hypothetical protein